MALHRRPVDRHQGPDLHRPNRSGEPPAGTIAPGTTGRFSVAMNRHWPTSLRLLQVPDRFHSPGGTRPVSSRLLLVANASSLPLAHLAGCSHCCRRRRPSDRRPPGPPLCPCVDYVVVFTGLAGGDAWHDSSPQHRYSFWPRWPCSPVPADLPGRRHHRRPGCAPVRRAFVIIIVVPLLLAWLTQWAVSTDEHRAVARGWDRWPQATAATMVPLMVLVLLVTASQVPHIDGRAGDVAQVVPSTPCSSPR